jgi:hypothetical protein
MHPHVGMVAGCYGITAGADRCAEALLAVASHIFALGIDAVVNLLQEFYRRLRDTCVDGEYGRRCFWRPI